MSTGGVVLLSSGTTGASKLVVRSLAALSADARQVVEALALRRDDSVAAAMPLCHSYGVDMMVAALLAGAALHVHSRFDPAALAADLRTGATVFPGVPFMYEALARADHTSTTASSGSMALRLAFSAGTPLHPRIAREMQRVWGLRIGQLYGLSELGSVTFNNPDSSKFDSASVGVPMRGVEIRIVDPDDSARVMESGVEGHVAIRARSMLSGYMPAEAPVLVHGFFPTGDLGKIDAAGRLYITGRLKLLIDVGGLKVNPLDVEAVLATHPDVAECVVVPLVVSDTVMRVRAVYVASDPLNPPRESELRAFMKERVSAFKVPRVFERVEVLPRSASGKVLRGQLMGEG